MLHVDFNENCTCKYTNETQALHFRGSHEQYSLHTGVLYVGKDTIPLCTISKSGQQDPPAIWTHLKPIIEMTREQNPQVTGARCSSVVRASAHGARVVGSILHGEPIELFLVQASAPRWRNKGRGMLSCLRI